MNHKIRLTFVNLFLSLTMFACILGSGGSIPFSTEPQVSVIIQGQNVEQLSQLVAEYHGTVTSRLTIIHAVGATIPADAVAKIEAEEGVIRVSPNATAKIDGSVDPKSKIKTPVTDYPDVTGADAVWKKGINGKGITVAVVDTGIAPIDGLTQDINGRSKHIAGWVDFVDKRRSPIDPNGHGTHIAGIIANTEKGADKEWNGTAPGARLVGVRVLDETGAGTYEHIIQGIQWVVDRKDKLNIRVMNLSLNGDVYSPYWADPLDQAVMAAWANGITVVVAAGNKGPSPMSIGVPANTPYVITVGAFTDHYTPNDWTDDYIASFSAAGPTLDGFVKPDIVAPGGHIVSTMKASSNIAKNHEANWVGKQYFSMAGTSQSAAVVSGIAALVLSKNPFLTPDEVKYRIMSTGFTWVDSTTGDASYSIWQQGSGRVNAYDAVFTRLRGRANSGMDIQADLNGDQHYEGYSYYDKDTATFRLLDNAESGAYTNWSGDYGIWSDKYGLWSDKYGLWSDKYGLWSDKYGLWSDKYGLWSDKYGLWSDKYGLWSDGYTQWSGGYGIWSGTEPWAGSAIAQLDFINNYIAGVSPDSTNTSASVGGWVEEQ